VIRCATLAITSRRAFLGTGLAAGLAAAAACSRREAEAPLRRAAQFLWSQQADDGGWHSRTYGLLRSGQSLTPFVLDALLDVDEKVFARPRGAITRAFEFLQRNTNSDGALGLADSVAPDYPNYATSLAVRVAIKMGRDAAAWLRYLGAQQFTESNGWKHDDAPYGAWGMGGARRSPPDAGHVDLSMTRHVLEALKAAGMPPSDPAMQKAVVYLDRCQNPDGGFYFSTVNTDTNKAGEEAGHYHSYGTTTADGILALRAAGVPATDPRRERAHNWLQEHHHAERVPGFENGPRAAWGLALRFYYAAAVIHASPGLPLLLPPQHSDGSWSNHSNLVKEDDPLIATGFAIQTLSLRF
jgi:hypothetical protein